MTTLAAPTRDTIVAFIADIFERCGDEEYLGEAVTMAQHMLQGATLAEKSGARDEIVVAALLHDIGHFTSEFGAFTMADTQDRYHEEAGATVLAQFFPARRHRLCALSRVGQKVPLRRAARLSGAAFGGIGAFAEPTRRTDVRSRGCRL